MINYLDMNKIDELYKKYDKIHEIRNEYSLSIIYRLCDLLEKRCREDESNVEYALSYVLFVLSECEKLSVAPEKLTRDILAPFMNDVRCVILRCSASYWWEGDDNVINKFDFDALLQNAKTKQERSVLCLYKSRAAGSDHMEYLRQSINWFPYNYNSIIEILKITDRQEPNYTMYKNMFLQCERLIFRIYPLHVENRLIYYKPYLYWEMGLANVMWSSVVENRGKLGFAKDELPPIDVTPFVDDKYFKDTLNRCSNFTHLKINNEVL